MTCRTLIAGPLILGLGATCLTACGLTLEPSASASLSGDRTTSVRFTRTAPAPAPQAPPEEAADP